MNMSITIQDVGLVDYYAKRAAEYENIYKRDDTVRLLEQLKLELAMNTVLKERNILEIACGTGYWTERLATVARHITAIDAAPETLEIARQKDYANARVKFQIGNAYDLQVLGDFNGGMSNFWLSHVPKAKIQDFLNGFHAQLQAGSTVFMADNVYYPAISSGQMLDKPGFEDSYAKRYLNDGSSFEIIKNYYTKPDLEQIFGHQSILEVVVGTCFWWVSYSIPERTS
jgi:SAM-dependent methyltransferase